MTQSVWYRVVQEPSAFPERSGRALLRAWLDKLCKRVASQYHRAGRQWQKGLHAAGELAKTRWVAPDPEQQRIAKERDEQLEAAVTKLEPLRRAVAIACLRDSRVWTVNDVGRLLKIPQGTAQNRFRLARLDLLAAGRRLKAKEGREPWMNE